MTFCFCLLPAVLTSPLPVPCLRTWDTLPLSTPAPSTTVSSWGRFLISCQSTVLLPSALLTSVLDSLTHFKSLSQLSVSVAAAPAATELKVCFMSHCQISFNHLLEENQVRVRVLLWLRRCCICFGKIYWKYTGSKGLSIEIKASHHTTFPVFMILSSFGIF